MSRIDNRILSMKFDNKQFERGIGQTLRSLNELDRSLDLAGAGQGLKKMGDDVDSVSSRFSNMGIVGMTVLQELTISAMNAGKRIARGLIDPIISGGKKRALNIEQAMFQFEGLGMDIDKSMESANQAVLGTAFGLDEAAKVAAQFGASGMQAGDEMTSALRAISGVAAMTSSSYEDIGNIFTTVSGNGRVMGNQLLQLSGRGLNAAAAIAKSMGISEKAVREMVTKGEIDFKTFYTAMDEAFGEHATAANKTFTGALSNMKAALGRIGASFYEPALVNMRDLFNALRVVIDDVHESLKPLIERFNNFATMITKKVVKALESIDFGNVKDGEKPVNNLSRALQGLKAAIGIVTDVIGLGVQAFGKLLKAMLPIFRPIGDLIGWLGDLVVAFRESYKGSEKTADGFKPLSKASEFLASMFDALVKSIEKLVGGFKPLERISGAISSIFKGLGKGIKNFVPMVSKGIKGLFGVLREIPFGSAADILNVGIIAGIGMTIKKFLGKLGSIIGKGSKALSGVTDILDDVRDTLASFQKQIDAETILKIAKAIAILSGSLFLLATIEPERLSNALGGLTILFVELFGAMAIFEKLIAGKGFKGITKVSTSMILLSTAILILSGAVKNLSSLGWKELTKGIVGVAGAMGILAASTHLFNTQGVKMFGTAAAMILLATAIRLMVKPVKELGSLDVKSMAKGIGAITALLGSLAIFEKTIDGKRLISTGIGMTFIARSMKTFAKAAEEMGAIPINPLIKGLGGMAVILAEVSIFSHLVSPGRLVKTSIAMGILASAMKSFASSVERMGSIPVKQLAKGLGGIGASLLILAGSMRLMPSKGIMKQAIALSVMASGMGKLSNVVEKFGGMGVKELAVGLGALAGSLTILAVALNLMKGSIGGALALTTAALGLNLLIPPLKIFGAMSVGQIAKGLAALAGAFVLLGATTVLISPLAPALLSLSGAMLVTSVAILATGKGIMMLSLGLAGLNASITGFISAIGIMIAAAITAIPKLVVALTKGIIQAVAVLGQNSEQIAEGFTTLMTSFGTAIFETTPVLLEGFADMLISIFELIKSRLPQMMDLGADIIIGFAKGIARNASKATEAVVDILLNIINTITKNMGRIAKAGADLIVSFITGISDNLPKVIDSAFKLIISFVNGLADAINDNHSNLVDAGINLGSAIIKAVGRTFLAAPRLAWTLVKDLVSGIFSRRGEAKDAGDGAGSSVISGIKGAVTGVFRIGANILKNLVDGIRSRFTSAREAGRTGGKRAKEGAKSGSGGMHSVGRNMMEGFKGGITSMASSIASSAKNVASGAVNGVKGFLGIKSPSRVFIGIGEDTGKGMAIGLEQMAGAVGDSAESLGEEAVDRVDGLDLSAVFDDLDFDPTITPVLDMDQIQDDLDSFMGRQNGSLNIGSTINKARSIPTNKARESDISDSKGSNVVNNFTQNNYSPKELSRLEIYRQTKNQLALLEGRQ